MRHSEFFAQACFGVIAAPMRLHPIRSQPCGEHDFDILDADGERIGVLEVTRALDEAHVRTVDAVFHPKRGGERVPRAQCRSDWGVSLDSGVNVRKVRQHLDSYLARLEDDGITEFFAGQRFLEPPSITAIREDLCIDFGFTITTDTPGAHWLLAPGVAAFSNPDAVNEAVRAEAAKDDNLRKLSVDDLSHRHLFVCIDTSLLAAYMALVDEHLAEPLVVDPTITHLWAAAYSGSRGGAIVWHAANGQPWSSSRCSLAGTKWDLLATEQAPPPMARRSDMQTQQ